MSARSEARTVEGWSDASGFGSRAHRCRSVSLCDPSARQASRVGGSPVRRGGAQHRASAAFDSRRRPLAQQLSSLFLRPDRSGDRSRVDRSRELDRQRGDSDFAGVHSFSRKVGQLLRHRRTSVNDSWVLPGGYKSPGASKVKRGGDKAPSVRDVWLPARVSPTDTTRACGVDPR